jgi:hypothetical protein
MAEVELNKKITSISNDYFLIFKKEIKTFKGQDYNKLKYQHDESNLFEDPLFPGSKYALLLV